MKLPEGYNIHHPFFPRRIYNANATTRVLRQLTIVPMVLERHNDLHANVEPIGRISLQLAGLSLDAIADSHIGMAANLPQLTQFEQLIDFYHALDRRRGGLGVEAGRFADHLEDQRHYMDRTAYL